MPESVTVGVETVGGAAPGVVQPGRKGVVAPVSRAGIAVEPQPRRAELVGSPQQPVELRLGDAAGRGRRTCAVEGAVTAHSAIVCEPTRAQQ